MVGDGHFDGLILYLTVGPVAPDPRAWRSPETDRPAAP